MGFLLIQRQPGDGAAGDIFHRAVTAFELVVRGAQGFFRIDAIGAHQIDRGEQQIAGFLDAPIVVDTADGRWRPGNYEGTFNGPVPLRIALEHSLNLVTLRVAQQVGMDAVADTAASR